MLRRSACAFMAGAIALLSVAAMVTPGWAPPLGGLSGGSGIALAMDDQPIERQIGGASRGVFLTLRNYFRVLNKMFDRAMAFWGKWIKRAAFYIAVALIAALADASLVNAWREGGLKVLTRYVPLMLYVYGNLLFSKGVNLAPKLVLLGALIYGVVRRDLIPDGRWVPGRLDDIALIVLATRAFVYACPEDLIDQYAQRAVNFRRRVASFQERARSR